MGTYERQERALKDTPKDESEAQQRRNINRKINNMTPKEQVKWIKDGD